MSNRVSEPAARPTCLICGEAILVAPELCHLCGTPHHWDCWMYNGGCATYACRAKVKRKDAPAAVAAARLEKIPFPQLAAGTFLGRLFVTRPTVVWIFAWELPLLFYATPWFLWPPGMAFCGTMMALGLLWARVTAARLNIDLARGCITRSKLVSGRELFEWVVCPLAEVERLEFREAPGLVPTRQLVATLRDRRQLELAPACATDSPDDRAVVDVLRRLESASTLALPELRKSLPLEDDVHGGPSTTTRKPRS